MSLGALGTALAGVTLDQWIKMAVAAPEIISAAIKLGETLKPVIDAFGKHAVKMQAAGHPEAAAAVAAHQQWTAAWTAADQRAADFQDGSRG